MADILDEVLHDHRDEKKLYYFRKFLPIVIVFSIIVVIAMLVNNWYSNKQETYNMEMGDLLLNAISSAEHNKKISYDSLSSIIEKSDNKVAEIASLEQVGIKISSNEYEQAKELLEKIISNQHFSSLTTSYSRLIWLSLVIDQKIISESEKEKFQSYMSYFTNEKQEFFGTISIIKALWYVRNNQIDLAKESLKITIALETITAVVKEQAEVILTNLERQ